ncbi:MAG: type II secretion system protein J [Patescibacteria group bacterium UBA2103]
MRGFLLIEGVIAAALTLLISAAIAGVYVSTSKVHEEEIVDAALLSSAEAGLSIARSIRDLDSENFPIGTFGVASTTGSWSFSGSSDVSNGISRSVVVSSVDENTFKVISTASSGSRSKSLSTYFSRWREEVVSEGTLVLDVSAASVGGSKNAVLSGITIENTGGAEVEIDTAVITWTGNRRVSSVTIDGVDFWTAGGVGSPNGNQTSGTVLDGTDIAIAAGDTVPMAVTFNNKVSGETFSVTLNLVGGGSVSSGSFTP